MLNNKPFYFSVIRKYVTLIGTLFDKIEILHINDKGETVEDFVVPVTYSTKDKMIARVLGDPNIDRKSASPNLPLITFEMGNMSFDSSRMLSSTNKTSYKKDSKNFKYQYVPVPYNFNFNVYIFLKQPEDGLRIIEQILPNFTPEWTSRVKLIPEMEEIKDIPVTLSSISMEDNSTGKFTDKRTIVWTLNLLLKGYIYGPINTAPIIKMTSANFFASTQVSEDVEKGEFNNTISLIPGMLANGNPTSNSSLSVPTDEIEATDDYGFITERTN